MGSNTESFELSKSETRALFSLEAWLTRLDIQATAEMETASRKTKWLKKWEEPLFVRSFFGLLGESPPTNEIMAVERIEGVVDMTKRTLLFCEALIFAPYFNIQYRDATNLQDEKDEDTRLHLRELWRANVFRIAEKLDVNSKILMAWEAAYLEALKAIGGRSENWKKISIIALVAVALSVTGGVAAPALGGLIGGLMGLSGAAATSAGLAFIGGGAIAAGGFGMAGGAIAIIGGGALLGTGLGGFAASRVFFIQHKLVLQQLAKLEASLGVVLEHVLGIERIIGETIERHILVLMSLKKELNDSNLDTEEKKKLKKTSEYYSNAIDRLHNLRKKIAKIN